MEQLGILEKRAFDGDLSVPNTNTNEVGMENLNVQIHKEMKRKDEKKQKVVPDSEGEYFTLCILGNLVCFLLSLVVFRSPESKVQCELL